jgi:hypothetical protein
MKKSEKCEKCGGIILGTEKWYTPIWKMCLGHSWKVNELDEIFSDELSINDRLLINDTDKNQSKQVKLGELIKFLKK